MGWIMGLETPPVPAALDSAVGEAADSWVVDAVVGSRIGLRMPPVPRALVTGLRIPSVPRALVTGLKIPSVPRALLRGVRIGPRRPPVLVAEADSVVRASSLGEELVG